MANFKGSNGSFLVLFKDDSRKEIFLIFRTDYPIWVLTGGGIEPGETPEKAAIREATEETSFKVKVIKSVGHYEFLNKDNSVLRKTFVYEGRVISGTYKPEFKGNIGKWFSINNLPPDITSATRRKITDIVTHNNELFIKRVKNELPFTSNLKLLFRHPFAFLKFVNKNFFRK